MQVQKLQLHYLPLLNQLFHNFLYLHKVFLSKDEFVRHKILDAIGDMALLEYTMIGEYDAIAGSHHLNHLLTKKLYEDKENYEIIDLEEAKHEAEMFEFAFAKQLNSEQ